MREVTDDSFQREVLEASEPVVVDFWAPWCGPCRAVEPVLAELEHEHEGNVSFAKLNIDENIETASRFSVLSIPTTILFEGGRPQETGVGPLPRAPYAPPWPRCLPSSTPSPAAGPAPAASAPRRYRSPRRRLPLA